MMYNVARTLQERLSAPSRATTLYRAWNALHTSAAPSVELRGLQAFASSIKARATGSSPSSTSTSTSASTSTSTAASAAGDGEPGRTVHFRTANRPHPVHSASDTDSDTWANPFGTKVWSDEEVNAVEVTHKPVKDLSDMVAYGTIKAVRFAFDLFSGYMFGPINEKKFLRRVIFLETVAGIPGMVAGSLRHLKSLRNMERDHGWIHTLLEEAENERMHLLTFTKVKNPNILFRSAVLAGQGIFWNMYFVAYLLSPRTCHRFIGYLEEEAVRTYTTAIDALDNGLMPTWVDMPAPDIAIDYWQLGDKAMMRDVLLAVRADEANHRDVNHTLSCIKASDTNPYIHKEH
eukprot:m.29424 g.29424  ORF g.29424 m.29424 type:complete len:347 (+) comp9160_c1_seq2:6334-7374(+)